MHPAERLARARRKQQGHGERRQRGRGRCCPGQALAAPPPGDDGRRHARRGPPLRDPLELKPEVVRRLEAVVASLARHVFTTWSRAGGVIGWNREIGAGSSLMIAPTSDA